ncbi:hypothetical protein ACFO5Z_24500 [Salipiger abyssi]
MVALSILPTVAIAQNLTTTVETTTVVSQENLDSASLSQLTSAIRSFNGKTVHFKGHLLYNSISEEEWWLATDDGLTIKIELDDGRQVTQTAKRCPSIFGSNDRQQGCPVSLDVELEIDSMYDYIISLKGIGFNVTFE